MTDRIEVRGLRTLGNHGALPGEQDVAQPFEVDIDIEADLERAAKSDDLGETVDYSAVIADVRMVIEHRRFFLIESLASAIAEATLAYEGVHAVKVTVRKLRPPVAGDVGAVAVQIYRARS